jgi:hypothetical protein
MKKWKKHIVIITVLIAFTSLSAQSDEKIPAGTIELVRLKYGGGGDWYNGPSELPNLADYVSSNLGIPIVARGKFVEPLSADLFNYPFLFMTGHGNVSFSVEEAIRLRTYLENGGFMFVNDDYSLDKPFRRELKKIFPDRKLVEIPFNHDIYHGFYDFPSGLPKIHEHDKNPAQGFGIFIDDRLALFYAYEADIADGWDDPSVHGNPPEKRKAALQMGANIIVHALSN